MDAETLDLCKENIQPLKRGRKASQLSVALQAQNDIELQEKLLKEREEYELSIITYNGPDPLEPRYNYVLWLEQTYPKHGRETNLIPILEDTIMLFKDDDRYKQDSRLVELIIKYIESQENELELYQMVYSQGLGTMCAHLYKSWAEALDQHLDVKRADQIYQLGIQNRAEPFEMLQQAHSQFQLSVGRRMMTGEFPIVSKQVSTETSERQRQVLGRIKKGSSIRPSLGNPGKVSVLTTSGSNRKSQQISVFQEDENDDIIVGAENCKINVVNSELMHKENTMKPQPWNKGFPRRRTEVSIPVVPSTPTFKVLADEEETTPQHNIEKKPTPITSTKVLKTRKAELQHMCPMTLFKSPHVGTKSNLPKFEVFAGGREFSFEEIRWAHYKKQIDCKDGTMAQSTPMKSGYLQTPYKTNTPYSTPFCLKNTFDQSDFATPLATPKLFPSAKPPVRPLPDMISDNEIFPEASYRNSLDTNRSAENEEFARPLSSIKECPNDEIDSEDCGKPEDEFKPNRDFLSNTVSSSKTTSKQNNFSIFLDE